MRVYTASELTYLQNREGYVAKALLWFSARNRSTGAIETMGLWTGDDDMIFNIGGEARTYLGAGNIVALDPIVMQIGLIVRTQRLQLPSFPEAIQQLILGYDLGLAPAEIHRAMFYPDTGAMVADPKRVWKGFVDRAPLPTPALDGEAPAEIILTSAARQLTRGLTLTYSNQIQRLRGDDRLLRYSSVAGVVRTPWGATMPQEPAPKPAPPANTQERETGRGRD